MGLTGIWAANRRFAGFRAMPLPFKSFLVTAVTAGTAVTVADRASLAFERRRYGGPEQQKVVLPTHADWKHKVPILTKARVHGRLRCGLVIIDGI